MSDVPVVDFKSRQRVMIPAGALSTRKPRSKPTFTSGTTPQGRVQGRTQSAIRLRDGHHDCCRVASSGTRLFRRVG